MTPHRWQTIKEFFNAAVDLPPAERAGFLESACRGDESVRREVESLLAAHVRGESFLAIPAFEMGASLLADSPGVPTAGDQIGRYKILSQLGSGGMGEVYLALDTTLGRNIALKLLPFDLAGDEHRMRRFEQEARTASALNHPNVCVIHEIGKTEDGRQFIAMEYVDGITLRGRMEQKRLTVTEALDVGAQIAWALEAAHAAGVVHRDVKPENIMLRRDGYVKVLDFGIAKLNEKDSAPLVLNEASTAGKVHTEPGTRMGTVRYMSPEQLRERPVDERTDIWSLGVVLHEMVTGSIPFTKRTTNETIAAILERQPLKITAFAADVPDELREIIAKALRKRRRERYQKVGELAHALRNVRRHVEAGARGPSVPPVGKTNLNAKVGSSQPSADRGTLPLPKRRTLISVTAASILTEIKAHKPAAAFATFGLILVIFFVSPYFARLVNGPRNLSGAHQQSPGSSQPADMERLTSSGTSVWAAVSPDGTKVAHVEKAGGKQEVQLTTVADHSMLQLVPSAAVEYRGVTFSPDGNSVYLTRVENRESGILYRVELSEKVLREIKSGVDSPVAFSPDGKQFSFVRASEANGEYWLMIANAEGSEERVIATRRGRENLSKFGPTWSPDGETIICGTGSWKNGYHTNAVAFGVADGREIPLGGRAWYSILQAAWRGGKGDLIISAREAAESPFQLWRVPYPQGEAERITTDTTEYKGVSVSRDGDVTVAIESRQDGKLWVGSDLDEGSMRVLKSTVGRIYGLNWIDKKRLVFSSMTGGNLNISAINADSSDQKPLTVNQGNNYTPVVSPDGRSIIFVSTRTGRFNIWRMNVDGSEPTPLTSTEGNAHPTISADGKWVLYDNQSERSFTLWKVAIDGGPPSKLSNEYAAMPLVSPDNQFIACRYYLDSGKLGIAILPFDGGPPLQKLPIPIADWQQLTWRVDGRALTYLRADDGPSNIWSYDLNGGSPKRLSSFASDQIYAYAWSPDHTQLAFARGTEIRDVIKISNQK
jgi:serine/threonine protein kinase/Tol biopolymer transport system component